ncbi:hypothetical protein SKAU_G00374190 [Synaphobranchus kaupii]|uniref:Uncharacterized protein n=1 Tax=Synaphobranchus kaupii TaxID=118154 RepID=A0A9Q1EGL9_SYNKA|nr:hypothetical protein SKAU_G00374190 [Synaphobranchus kaupii]
MPHHTAQPRGTRGGCAHSECSDALHQGTLPLHRGPGSISPSSPLGRALTLSCSSGECWSCAFEPRFPPTTIKSAPPPPAPLFSISSPRRVSAQGVLPTASSNPPVPIDAHSHDFTVISANPQLPEGVFLWLSIVEKQKGNLFLRNTCTVPHTDPDRNQGGDRAKRNL